MFNPEIVRKSGPYEAEEGCLSLDGTRKTKRWKSVKARYQNRDYYLSGVGRPMSVRQIGTFEKRLGDTLWIMERRLKQSACSYFLCRMLKWKMGYSRIGRRDETSLFLKGMKQLEN